MQQSSYPRRTSARKPQTPAQQLQSAVKRAQEGNITVVGSGLLTDGRSFFLVPSQSVAGMHHVVTTHGKHLQCDCFYDRMQHKVCVHRAAAYLFLLAEDKLKQKAQPVKTQQSEQPQTQQEDQWDRYQMARMAGEL